MCSNFTSTLAATALLALSSCAGSYRPIRPERLSGYVSVTSSAAPVDFAYQYGTLTANGGGNKKYIKKERKFGYQTVAVRIKNNTTQDLNFSRDLELYFGDRNIAPVPALQASLDIRQGVAIHTLYILLNFPVGGTYDKSTGQIIGSTFLPIGPFIAAGNMIGAATANTNMREEFKRYEMINKIIKPGETVYGIVSLRESGVAPLRLVLRHSAAMQPEAAPAPAAAPAPTPAATPATGGGSN